MPISSVGSMTIRIMVKFDTQVDDLLACPMNELFLRVKCVTV